MNDNMDESALVASLTEEELESLLSCIEEVEEKKHE